MNVFTSFVGKKSLSRIIFILSVSLVCFGCDKVGDDTPKIVKEQQEKEKKRQDTTWTAENRAAHPIEYLRAQQEELVKHKKQLEVSQHKIKTAIAATQRELDTATKKHANLTKFMDTAKTEYKKASESKQWPVVINGYKLDENKLKVQIMHANNEIKELNNTIETKKRTLSRLDIKAGKIYNEFVNIEQLSKRIQTTITDLETKKIVEGDEKLGNVLNGIGDSVNAMMDGSEEPNLEDLTTPAKDSVSDEEFNSILNGK